MRVKEIMSSPVITVTPETRIKDAAALLVDRGIGAVPVVTAAGRLAGIVSEADLVALEPTPDPRRHARIRRTRDAERTPTLVRDLMTRRVITLRTDSDVAEAARLMLKHGFRSIPLIDGEQVVGMVARRDLLKILAREDRTIATNVSELLEEQAGFIFPFTVEVRNGVVTLTGTADPDARNFAELLARTVPGVVAIRFANLPEESTPRRQGVRRA